MRQEIVTLKTKPIQKFLSLASTLYWKQSRDILTKSVLFRFSENKLTCYATDFDTYIECELDIEYQTDEEFDIILLTQSLSKLLKLGEDEFKLKIGDPVFIFLLDSWIPIEQINVQNSRFILGDEIKPNLVKIDSLPFSLIPIVNKAVLTQDKYINILEGVSYSRYLTSRNSCTNNSPITYQLSLRELSMLKLVQDTEIYIGKSYSDYPRLIFISKSDDCELKFSFLYIDAEESTIPKHPEFFASIKKDFLIKILDLTEMLPTSLQVLEIFTDDNKLKIISKNKLKDMEFELCECNSEIGFIPLEKTAIQFLLLNNIVKSFDKSKYINISWDSSKLYLTGSFVSEIMLR